ncbi:MAG: IS3 family transposase, partial [Steroidobacteraceae bacterium]
KKSRGLLREGEQMKFALIDEEKAHFPICFMCRQLDVSRSGFYAWKVREPSEHAKEDAALTVEIGEAHRASRGRYGSPRIHAELRARGRRTSRKRVARLMRRQGLQARRKRRFRKTTDSRHGLPVAANLLQRNFSASAPDRIWVTDITYVWTRQGWLYLAAILDLFARRVVGWATSETLETSLCFDALRMALKSRRPPPGLIHHSDRGCQYASHGYRHVLKANGIVCSMSRKGDCWDNAVAESFFGSLKAELVDEADFASRSEARAALFEYIEVFYNRQRRHSRLAFVSPVEYESAFQKAALPA